MELNSRCTGLALRSTRQVQLMWRIARHDTSASAISYRHQMIGLRTGRNVQKKNWRPHRPPVNERTDETLETKLRTEGNPQIVVRAVVEENVVTRFGPQPNPVREDFNTRSRVNRQIGSTIR